MSNKLADFITVELEQRNWSVRELARKSGLAHTTISDVIAERTNPGLDFCVRVAQALHTQPENVLRLAGLLPPLPEETMLTKEVIHVFHQLDGDQQQEALAYLRWMRDRRNQAVTKTSTA